MVLGAGETQVNRSHSLVPAIKGFISQLETDSKTVRTTAE